MWGPLYVTEKLMEFRLEEAEREAKRHREAVASQGDKPGAAFVRLAAGGRQAILARQWWRLVHTVGRMLVGLGTRLEGGSHPTTRPDSGLIPEGED